MSRRSVASGSVVSGAVAVEVPSAVPSSAVPVWTSGSVLAGVSSFDPLEHDTAISATTAATRICVLNVMAISLLI